MKFLKQIVWCLQFFLPFLVNAQTVFLLPHFDSSIKYSGSVSYLPDTSFSLSVDDFAKLSKLPVSEKAIPDLGWGKFRGWIRLDIKSSETRQLFVQVHNPVFDEFNIYFYSDHKQISRFENIRKGSLYKPNSFRLVTVPFDFKKDSLYQIYISGVSKFNPVKFPIRILTQRGLNEFRDSENLYNGLLIGVFSILIILNILIFFFFRIRIFLIFSFSNVSFLLLYLYLEGYLFGHSFSKIVFENTYFNFQYLIYYGFQIFNFVFVWSVYRLFFLNKTPWNLTYSILLTLCLIEGSFMFLSPLWEVFLSHQQTIFIGHTIRVGALLLNVFLLVIILKTWYVKSFSKWLFVGILPGWLSYVVPRFAAVFLHDTWVTLPFLYSVSSIWNVVFISVGLFIELSKNYKSKIEKEPAAEGVLVEELPQKTLQISKLSKRETEILQAFANGFSYQEISDAMFISPHTVRTHIKNIYNKLEINSKAEAVRWVIGHQ